MEDKVMKNASPRNKNLIKLLYFGNTPKPHCMHTMRFFSGCLPLRITAFGLKLLLTSKVPSYRRIHRHDSQISAESCDSHTQNLHIRQNPDTTSKNQPTVATRRKPGKDRDI